MPIYLSGQQAPPWRAGDAWPVALLHAVMLCAACTLVLALGPQGVAFDSEKPPAFAVGRCHYLLLRFACRWISGPYVLAYSSSSRNRRQARRHAYSMPTSATAMTVPESSWY